jgi:transposase-like protein
VDLDKFRTEPIEDIYKYLLIDGLWIKVLDKNKRLRKKVILFVSGITTENKKRIVAFKLADGETEEEVTSLLNDLYRRGLKGKYLRLIASDGSKGIKAAIKMVYPYVLWQLCSTHKLRNLSGHIRYKIRHQKQMMEEASCIYQSETRKQALERYEAFCRNWKAIEPHAIRCFEKDFEDTLAYYAFDSDRNFISTTNHIERDQEEVRRRIKTQGYFKSERSLNLWIYGIISLFREEPKPQCKEKQPGAMPQYAFSLIKEPIKESAQLS